MTEKSLAYKKKILNPFLFKIYMLQRLPSVFFWGVTVKQLTDDACTVCLPYSWKTRNPFFSIYFAAMAGAAELSTGVLCQMLLAERTPHSMLVVAFKMEYYKKSNTEITFTCNQGKELKSLLDSLHYSGDNAGITLTSNGADASGQIVSKAEITWSFKRK